MASTCSRAIFSTAVRLGAMHHLSRHIRTLRPRTGARSAWSSSRPQLRASEIACPTYGGAASGGGFLCLIARGPGSRREALLCRHSPTRSVSLAPSQHGGARSGASDDEGGGSQARGIARRCPGRTNEQTRSSSASERGRQRLHRAILASGASNQTLREQL